MISRRFLLELFGIAPAIPAIERIEALEVHPGDAIVVTCDEHLSAENAQHIKAQMESMLCHSPGFDGVQVLVLSKGLEIGVLRPAGEKPEKKNSAPCPPPTDLDPTISTEPPLWRTRS